MKKMKKLMAFVLIGIMCASAVAGCGKGEKKASNSTTDVQIAYWNSGLGTDWLDAAIEGFKKVHPEYNVYYTATANSAAVSNTYGLEDIDTVDLYLTMKNADTTYMEPLNDILDSVPAEESKSIGQKFEEGYLALETSEDGNVYNLTYGGGLIGIVYNKAMFEEAGITTLPRTTDELVVVCDTLYKKGIVPMGHFKEGGYWDFMTEAFFMQYDGMDYYLNTFYASKGENGESPSKDLFFKKDGRYETLKAYEKFLLPQNVLQGSNSNDHITMQTEFLSNKCAMMVSGSWMSNEMSGTGKTDNFVMMKTPVISSIVDKLTTVTKESELRKVINAVDSVTDGVKTEDEYKQGDSYVIDGLTVSAEDWTYVKKARNTMAMNYSGDAAYIPNYSNAKEGAKEFLKYLYSDDGYEIYTDTLHIALPFTKDSGEVDTDDWNAFEKSQYELLQTTEQYASYYNMGKHKLFTTGGAASLGYQQYIAALCTKNDGDRKNADEIWKDIMTYIDNNYESNWLANIK